MVRGAVWACSLPVALAQDVFLHVKDDPFMYAAHEWYTGNGEPVRPDSISTNSQKDPAAPVSVSPPLGFQPNFVFILTDDQDTTLGRDGYTDIGSMEVMPKVNSIMTHEGASFKHFYVNTPICCPSRTEFFSGRYYHNVGPPSREGSCMHVDTSFASKKETGMFGLMKTAGYNVGVFGKVTNDQQKILDEIVQYGSANFIDSPLDYNNFVGKTYYQYDEAASNVSSVETISGDWGALYQTSQIGNRTLKWLDTAIAKAHKIPFFAYIGPHAPHFPAMPAPWYATAFDDVDVPITPNYNCSDEIGGGKSEHVQKIPPLTEQVKCWEKRHFTDRWASLLSVDDLVDDVYTKIATAGLADRTYFIYTSDHGYKQGQWRIGTSKQHPYETDIRIPFIMRGPGIKRGSQPTNIGANVDLLPTLLELAAGAVFVKAVGLDGRSMLPFLVPDVASTSAWRHFLLNEYKSVGTYYNDHSAVWENGSETRKKCGGGQPRAPSASTTASECTDSDGFSTGKCFMVDSTASNNWRQLRILNATHNWNYVEYDRAFKFEDPDETCGMATFSGTACTKRDVYDTSMQTDAGACCAHCSADTSCAQWTFHTDGKCYLVNTTQDRVAQSDSTCGIQGKAPTYGLQHIELYDQTSDRYQMTNIYDQASDAEKHWLHETLHAYFLCAGESCP